MSNRILKKIDIIILAFLLAVTFLIGSYRLLQSPPVWYDEGLLMQVSENIAKYGEAVIQQSPDIHVSAGFISTGTPFLYPLAGAFKLFGIGLLEARSFMVFVMMLFVSIFYLSALKFFGRKQAVLTTLLLVFFSSFYGNGKNVLGEIPGLLFLFLSLFFLYKLEKNNFGEEKYLFLAGIFSGLTASIKPIFLPFLPAIFLGFIISKRLDKKYIFKIIRFFIYGMIPILIWLKTQFGAEDTLPTILKFYSNPYYIPFKEMMLNVFDNFLRFFKEFSPIYFMAFFIIWIVGGLLSIKKKIKISIAEKIAFIFVLFILVAYLRTLGWYRYFFPAHIVVLFFAPRYIKNIADTFFRKYTYIIVAFIYVALFSLGIYQIGWGSWLAKQYNNTKTDEFQNYFSNNDLGDKSILLYNVPEAVVFLKTSNYYQYMLVQPEITRGASNLRLVENGLIDYILISNSDLSIFSPDTKYYKKKADIQRYSLFEHL
ncbi:glycosyltransferase family 39 protein [Candidatus Parcubacteria bacterium]|nr:glycosyltransferase family 39 protein [Candidatus Parcubacteria bacterium]